MILLIRSSGLSCTAAINPSKERSLWQAASLVTAIYLLTGLGRSSGFVCKKSNAFSSGIPSNKMSNLSDTTISEASNKIGTSGSKALLPEQILGVSSVAYYFFEVMNV